MSRRAIIVSVIFLVLLVAMLSWTQKPAMKVAAEQAKLPKGRLDVSINPVGGDVVDGPVYLTSNLPVARAQDDVLPLVTEGLPSLGGASNDG